MDEIDEVLNLQQRQARKMIMRRYQNKIERAKELAKKRMAPDKNIKKRAYAEARQIVRKRFAGKKGAEYEKLGPSEKISIDRAIEKKQALIKRIALRLLPRVKAAEQKRLQSFVKGQALVNTGTPEGHTKVNESFMAFAEKFDTENEKAKLDTGPDEGKTKTVKSKSKNPEIKYYNKFGEQTIDALDRKAEKSGIDVEVLGEVYNRGLDAWNDHPKVTREQYAFARVNSFINKGKSYYAEDADLVEETIDEKRGLWDNIHAKRKRIKAGSGERMRKPGSKGAPTVKNFKDAQESVEIDEAGSKYNIPMARSKPKTGTTRTFGSVLDEVDVPVKHLDRARSVWKRTNDVEAVKKFVARVKEDLDEGIDKSHPIVKEYDSLKKHDIKTLRGMINQHHKVIDTSEFKTKDHAISHLLRQKHGNKKVDQAFGFNEEVELDEAAKLGKHIGTVNGYHIHDLGANTPHKAKRYLAYHNSYGFISHTAPTKTEINKKSKERDTSTTPKPRTEHDDWRDEQKHRISSGEVRRAVMSRRGVREEVEIEENAWNQLGQKKPVGNTLPAPARGTVPKHNRKFSEGDHVVPHTGPHAGEVHRVTSSRSGSVNIVHPNGKYDTITVRAKHEHLSPATPEQTAKYKADRQKDAERMGLALKEEIDESNNTPYVRPHIEKGSTKQSGWKASNKHGRVKYFGMDFKKSAEKHAGIDEACDCTEKEREDVVNVARPTTKKSVLTKQGEIEKKIIESSQALDESFNIVFASGVGVTLTAADLGMKAQGGFALHPSVIAEMEERELEEDAESALKKPVYMPPRRRQDGSYGPAKTVLRKTGKKIIDNTPQIDADSDPHDGQ